MEYFLKIFDLCWEAFEQNTFDQEWEFLSFEKVQIFQLGVGKDRPSRQNLVLSKIHQESNKENITDNQQVVQEETVLHEQVS